MAFIFRAGGAAAALILAGCSTSSHVLIGKARPPISPEQVRVYVQPPARYEQIASLSANSTASLALTGQQNMDKAMERMKAEAAKVGANGILLQGVQDQQSGAIGTGIGSASYGPRSSVGGGIGGSFGLYSKVAQGLAIYVPPEVANAPPAPPPAVPAQTEPPPAVPAQTEAPPGVPLPVPQPSPH